MSEPLLSTAIPYDELPETSPRGLIYIVLKLCSKLSTKCLLRWGEGATDLTMWSRFTLPLLAISCGGQLDRC